MCDNLTLDIPEYKMVLSPGCKIKLSRFDTTTWVVSHGWFTWGGNRPFCGWYLTNIDDPTEVKPLQKSDLDDIYMIQN